MSESASTTCRNQHCKKTLNKIERDVFEDECHACASERMNQEMLDEQKASEKALKEKLDSVLAMLNEKDKNQLVEIMKETTNFDFELVDKPEGEEYEPESPFFHGCAYVDQPAGGGITGDDFSGHMYIPVGERQYFKYYYVC